MSTTSRWVARLASVAMLLTAAGAADAGPPRRAVPHGGGGAPRAAAPARHAPRASGTATRGLVPARGTANGVARYGYGYGYPSYGYGYGYGYGYPYYGYGYGGGWWGYPYWSVGWYGGWGWPYGWDYAPTYTTAYVPYEGAYVVAMPVVDPRTPATVLTKFSPTKAEILVDGVSVGFAKDYNGRWDSLTIPPGRHTVTFRSEGFTTVVIDLEAAPGARYVFGDDLVPGEGEVRRSMPTSPPMAAAPPQAEQSAEGTSAAPAPPSPIARGRLKVQASPEDAAVYLDGEYLGLAGELARLHGAIAVATGSHRLDIVRPGFVSALETIEVSATDIAVVQLTLARAP